MMGLDTEILAGLWVDDENDPGNGDLLQCIIDVERSDLAEIRIGIRQTGEEDTTHVYIAPDRAVKLAQALIYTASKEWRGV